MEGKRGRAEEKRRVVHTHDVGGRRIIPSLSFSLSVSLLPVCLSRSRSIYFLYSCRSIGSIRRRHYRVMSEHNEVVLG